MVSPFKILTSNLDMDNMIWRKSLKEGVMFHLVKMYDVQYINYYPVLGHMSKKKKKIEKKNDTLS